MVVVDWSELCGPPFYWAAVDNVRLVAAHVTELLEWLASQGLTLKQVHIIGHSVGAHIAGVVGQQTKHLGQLARITGLDPAKPMFELESSHNRITSGDAAFVDCIHTCGGYLGVSEPECDSDFYPNRGTNPQPGCTFDFFGKCSHQRAYRYFAESIGNSKAFQSVKCSAMKGYSPDNCSQVVDTRLGEHTNTRSYGIYYVFTSSSSPFSLKSQSAPVSISTQFLWYFHYS